MYKCNDCGKQYIERVEYCDCGNNTFTFVEEIVKTPKTVKKPLSIDEKSQIISLSFFVICLVLSLIVWLIPVKTVHNEVKVEEETKPAVSIPDIEKIWDSTPVKIVQKTVPSEPENINNPIPLNVIPYDNKISQPKNTKPDVIKPSTAQPKKSDKKVVQTKPTQNLKPVQAPKTQNTKPKEQAKPINTQSNKNLNKEKPKQQTTQPKVENQPKKTEEIKLEKPKKVYNPNSPEMLKYKGELRAVLFKKFPVGSIQGSGKCSIHFSIDSSGKLTNRGFTKLSDNKSLNDAVYYMMMSVPRYSAPPASYSGETINMNFSVNNGNYEITIQ